MPYSPRRTLGRRPDIRQPWPDDEYLRDGGDEGRAGVIGGRHELGGVETDDTVAVYKPATADADRAQQRGITSMPRGSAPCARSSDLR